MEQDMFRIEIYSIIFTTTLSSIEVLGRVGQRIPVNCD